MLFTENIKLGEFFINDISLINFVFINIYVKDLGFSEKCYDSILNLSIEHPGDGEFQDVSIHQLNLDVRIDSRSALSRTPPGNLTDSLMLKLRQIRVV